MKPFRGGESGDGGWPGRGPGPRRRRLKYGRGSPARKARAAAVALLAWLCAAGGLGAQTPATSDSVSQPAAASRGPDRRTAADTIPMFASPPVPPGDWSRDAARRLAAMGLVPGGFDRGQGLVTRRELALLFADAVASAEADRPDLAPLARAYRDRFRDEFGDVLAGARGGARIDAGWVGAGYARLAGRVATGVGLYNVGGDWTGTHPIPDSAGVLLEASFSASLSHAFAVSVEPELLAGKPRLRSGMLEGVLWNYVGVWAGRFSTRFGPGEDGGIVLSDAVPFDGVGFFTAQPFRLPWLLRVAGPARLEGFVSKVYGGDKIRDPFFLAGRGTITPVPRLTVGLNRGSMFAGRGNAPITLHNMVFLLTGGVRGGNANALGGFANDVLSVDLSWRPPTERVLPLALYVEWGADDAAGAWMTVPGALAGIEAAALPGVPWLGWGVEAARFTHSCCSHGLWYRNWSLRQGWSDYGVPVGHPLAGEGTEIMTWGTAALWDARLTLRAAAFGRDRGPESTLAPERAGRSAGGWLRAELRLAPRVRLVLDGAGERGSGWTTSALRTTARIGF